MLASNEPQAPRVPIIPGVLGLGHVSQQMHDLPERTEEKSHVPVSRVPRRGGQ